jgi:acyl-CoA reductase-like NAD-dependent aldehyde dehydrogenase
MATTALDVSRHAPISHPDRFYIGGEWVRPSTESHIDVIAPATEELFLRVAEAQEADIANAVAAARVLRSVTVGHNMFRSDFGIAFGGFKQSGLGREGGVDGLLPFLEAKTIILEGVPARLSHSSRSRLLHN